MKSNMPKEYWERAFPLCSVLIKNQIIVSSYDQSIFVYVMNNTPIHVLNAFERHLQGEL